MILFQIHTATFFSWINFEQWLWFSKIDFNHDNLIIEKIAYHPSEANAIGSKRVCSPIPEQSKWNVVEKVLPFLDSVMGSQSSCGFGWQPWKFVYLVLFEGSLSIIVIVGSRFVAQAQKIWDMSPMSPIHWICREWVKELGS